MDASGKLLVADQEGNAVVRIDLNNGHQTILSNKDNGKGEALYAPMSIAVEANGNILVGEQAEFDGGRLVRIASKSGDRTVISELKEGEKRETNPIWDNPSGIVVESAESVLIITQQAEIFRVNLEDGTRTLLLTIPSASPTGSNAFHGASLGTNNNLYLTLPSAPLTREPQIWHVNLTDLSYKIISSNSVGGGEPFGGQPQGIAINSDGKLIVSTYADAKILSIDPKTGDRTLISNYGPADKVNWYDNLVALAIGQDGSIYVADSNLKQVAKVNPETGGHSPIMPHGIGPYFRILSGIAVEANGNILVREVTKTSLIRVDPQSGNRLFLNSNYATMSSGHLSLITLDPSEFILSGNNDQLIRTNPVNGDSTVLSGNNKGTGTKFKWLLGVAVENDGNILVTVSGLKAIVRVDPITGNRTILSNATTGTGVDFNYPWGIAVEDDGNILVIDYDLLAIVRVDPKSGNRMILSDKTTGTGTNFSHPSGIALENDGNILVTDRGLQAIVRVDPKSGNRTILLDKTTGTGTNFNYPIGIALENDGNILVTDTSLNAVIRVDPKSGDRIILSQ